MDKIHFLRPGNIVYVDFFTGYFYEVCANKAGFIEANVIILSNIYRTNLKCFKRKWVGWQSLIQDKLVFNSNDK